MKARVYTDGACSGNPGPGGWAALILLETERQEISGFEPDTTNNRMELRAVVESIKLVLSLGYKRIDIYSDSAYVVNAVEQNWIKKWSHNGWKTKSQGDVKNKDLWIELLKLLDNTRFNGNFGKDRTKINLVKVAGHSGDKNNDLVDGLAKREIDIHRKW